ncbi:MAG: sugar ABC transporter permease [Ruthenibacterium sp.]
MYSNRKKTLGLAALFLGPAMLVLLVYSYLPTPYALYLSMTESTTSGKQSFIGLENYARLFRDSDFWESCGNTFWYALMCTVIMIFLGIIMAIILNRKVRGSSFYISVMFVPWVISDVVVGATWRWLFNPDFGVLNYLFSWTGFRMSDLIAKPKYVMIGIMIVTVWKMLAYTTILLLAGLQSISNDCIEAARIDGCNAWGIFWKIIFPNFSSTILVVTLLTVINCINQSGMILILTNGGPIRASETLALYLYKEAFRNYQLNSAASLSMVLAVVNIAIAIIYLFLSKKNKEAVE